MVFPRRFLSTVMRDQTEGSRRRARSTGSDSRSSSPRPRAASSLRSDPQARAQLQRGDHPQRHRLAVEQIVSRGRLQRVADRVAEVEDGTPPGLRLVLGDHPRLHPHRARHQLPHQLRREVRPALLAELQDDRIGDEPALDHLRQTGGPLARRQRPQEPQIGDHHLRLVKGPDEVLARHQIDARLAAHRGVDHRQQRGRDGGELDSAQIDRGGEPGVIGRRAAADADDGAPAIVAAADQPFGRLFDLPQALASLPLVEIEAGHARQPGVERRDQGGGPHIVCQPAVDQQRHTGRRRPERRRHRFCHRVGREGADPHLVAARPQLDRNDRDAHALSFVVCPAALFPRPSPATMARAASSGVRPSVSTRRCARA